jgi:hypothetical protein
MAADGTIGGGKLEYGDAMFLAHGNQAPIMLYNGKAIRVIRWLYICLFWFVEYIFTINNRDAVGPFVINFDRTLRLLDQILVIS